VRLREGVVARVAIQREREAVGADGADEAPAHPHRPDRHRCRVALAIFTLITACGSAR
jgi:hypothetical protein